MRARWREGVRASWCEGVVCGKVRRPALSHITGERSQKLWRKCQILSLGTNYLENNDAEYKLADVRVLIDRNWLLTAINMSSSAS